MHAVGEKKTVSTKLIIETGETLLKTLLKISVLPWHACRASLLVLPSQSESIQVLYSDAKLRIASPIAASRAKS